jgi:hypothetical protein
MYFVTSMVQLFSRKAQCPIAANGMAWRCGIFETRMAVTDAN